MIEDASGAFGVSAAIEWCLLRFANDECRYRPSDLPWDLLLRLPLAPLRDGFESRREQHDAEEAMPEAFTALSMSLAAGHSLAQGMRFVGAHAQRASTYRVLRVAAAIDCGIRRPTHSMTCSCASTPPVFRL